MTDNSTKVLRALDLGIIPNLSKVAIPIPGITKIGKPKTILLEAVYKTAFLALIFEIPISSPYSS